MKSNDKELYLSIEKRLKTTMIGAIARFEEEFGYLWNHGDVPKTENAKLFKYKWDNLRTDLLNHGNNQMRLAINDIKHYVNNIDKYDYRYDFIIKNKNNNNNDRR